NVTGLIGGAYPIRIIADAMNEVTEQNETNNEFLTTISFDKLPKIEITSFSVAPGRGYPPTYYIATAEIKNVGDITAHNIIVKFIRTVPKEKEINKTIPRSLKPGEKVKIKIGEDNWTQRMGIYEGNNVFYLKVYIGEKLLKNESQSEIGNATYVYYKPKSRNGDCMIMIISTALIIVGISVYASTIKQTRRFR
ncbi:MAG: hypothetical protein AB1779_02705, partial [Candidatus Thermoplasmatota archaeon]